MTMHGKKVKKTVLILLLCPAAIFLASVVVYMFNLDMKLIAVIQPQLAKVYDSVERRPMP